MGPSAPTGEAGRGHPVSGDFVLKAINTSGLRQHIHKLRQALVGSRYSIADPERHLTPCQAVQARRHFLDELDFVKPEYYRILRRCCCVAAFRGRCVAQQRISCPVKGWRASKCIAPMFRVGLGGV
jgi:hypothetical protein